MSETMSRPPSSRSLRRASSPPALLYLKTPPPESPLRRTTSSPSICFQYTSLCDLLRSPSSTPTPPPKEPGAGSALADPERREPIKVSSPALSRDCNWGCGLWSRSTQTEPVAESSTQTDRDTTDAELLQGGQAGHTFRRFLGVQWDGSFLMLLGVLAVVIFTVAVIATLSGTTRANKKFDSLDLMPDAFEGDPSSAQQDVEVTAPSTCGKVAVGRRGLSRRAQRHVPARKRSTAAISNDNAMAEMKAGNDVAAGSEKASSFAVDA